MLCRRPKNVSPITWHDIFLSIWDTERVPDDWKKGIIIKLPKKGDLTSCGNWRGITLLTTASKVLGRIIIKRIAKEVDRLLREEQAGFRAGRSTTEQIFILRNIVEQAIEWNSNLYLCFIDFEKAFDSVHRDTLWKIMKSYRIPSKLIRIIKAMYNESECAVQTGSGLTEWFQVKSGVKQGCNMSGFLFLLVIDWIMKKATADNSTGIRWKFTSKLEDLDFADDIALISSNRQQIQTKTDRVNHIAGSTGLKINTSKTQVMRINPTSNAPVTLNGKDLEEVDSFIYLGATVSKSGGAADDMKRRLGLARIAFNKLSKIWKDSHIGRKTKLKIFRSNVVSVLLYGSETWKVTKGDDKRLDVFLHSCLRRIFKIY